MLRRVGSFQRRVNRLVTLDGLDRLRRHKQLREKSYSGNGAQGRNRTTDTAIFSRMLYQLSYLGAGAGISLGDRALGVGMETGALPSEEACIGNRAEPV